MLEDDKSQLPLCVPCTPLLCECEHGSGQDVCSQKWGCCNAEVPSLREGLSLCHSSRDVQMCAILTLQMFPIMPCVD